MVWPDLIILWYAVAIPQKSWLLPLQKPHWYLCICLTVVSSLGLYHGRISDELICMLASMLTWSGLSLTTWQFDVEKVRWSWCGNRELTLMLSFHMAPAALKSHAGSLYPSFYTGKNSRQWQSPLSWSCEVIVCRGISVCEEAIFLDIC